MSIEKLLEIASPPSAGIEPEPSLFAGQLGINAARDLTRMLAIKNGFFAFESALHVRPGRDSGELLGIAAWNAGSLWRDWYQGLTDGLLFFAEDAFGGQFAVRG